MDHHTITKCINCGTITMQRKFTTEKTNVEYQICYKCQNQRTTSPTRENNLAHT